MQFRNNKIRVLLCNPGLDGHDRGVKVIARSLRDHGMEVIYLPLRSSIEEVVSVALQEDVDVIGISNLSATLVHVCHQLHRLLNEAGANDVLIVAGGTVIASDYNELSAIGISGVFGPGSDLSEIIDYIEQNVRQKSVTAK